MQILQNVEYGGERPLFALRSAELDHVVIHPGESALKHVENITARDCLFEGKYPFWHAKHVTLEGGRFAPGARAAINSEPGGPGGLVTVSRKGSGHMFLKVQGKASHAGRCYADGASAILEIAHKTLAIDTFLDLDRGLTVNTGLISGGVSANSVAPWAESRIHLTYRTLEDGQKVVACIRDAVSRTVIPGTSASISGGLRLYPFERCEAGDKLFGLVKDAGELLGMSIKGQHYDSASEAGFSSSLGVPTICNMGPEGEHIHSLNEYLVPSSIVKRCKLIALTALQASRVFQPGK